MCQTWMLLSTCCCRLSEGRAVCIVIYMASPRFSLYYRQRNVDYAFCQATQKMAAEQGLLAIYDVGCQWSIHLKDRIRKSRFLSMPDFEEFIVGIGKFHLGGHILTCFPKFSLNFI